MPTNRRPAVVLPLAEGPVEVVEESEFLTHTYYTILSNRSIFQLAANPENFSLVETPTSELPGHTLKESFIKVSTRHPNLYIIEPNLSIPWLVVY